MSHGDQQSSETSVCTCFQHLHNRIMPVQFRDRIMSTHPTLIMLTFNIRLKDADIIPAVIGDFIPSFLLNISFHSNQSPFLGSTLEPPMLQEAPKANLYSPPRKHHSRHSSNSQSAISTIVAKLPLNNLVVAMTDPDAPSRANPKWGEICHWIAVGVPVNISSSASGVSTKGQLNPDAILKELMPYKPPGPPPKTGKHRYVLLAFTPKNGTSFPLDLVKPVDRMHWGYGMKGYGVKQWAEDMGLLPIGKFWFASFSCPHHTDAMTAAEFFTAQHVA